MNFIRHRNSWVEFLCTTHSVLCLTTCWAVSRRDEVSSETVTVTWVYAFFTSSRILTDGCECVVSECSRKEPPFEQVICGHLLNSLYLLDLSIHLTFFVHSFLSLLDNISDFCQPFFMTFFTLSLAMICTVMLLIQAELVEYPTSNDRNT